MAKRTLLALAFITAMVGIPFASHAWTTHYFGKNLKDGETGVEISFLQQYLTEQGYFHYSTTTDYFGPITFAAVKTWQANNGIPSTGFFGPISRAFVNATDTPSVAPVVATSASVASGTFSYCWILGACGSDVGTGVGISHSSTSSTPGPITVSISPTSTSIFADATTSFSATVTNASNTAVIWSASLGTINTSGVYTPPVIIGTSTVTDTITATSQADNTKSATTTITISSGLTGYWPLDEGTGTIALDATANGLNGAWVGTKSSASGTYYSAGAVAGPSMGYFNGTDDYIDMGSSTLFNTQSVTLSAWVYPTAFSGQNIIMGKEFQYKYTIDSGQFTILSTCYGGDGWDVDTNVASATLDEWENVTFVENASSAVDQFYLNGSLVYSTSTCGAVNVFTDNDFEIGAYASATAPFQGSIDDARYYDRALTTAQVSALYNLYTPPGPSIAITPSTLSMHSGATTTAFSATFTNDPGDVAMWSASPSGGSINPATGAYTAPTVYSTTTVTIYAQSQTIGAVSSTATVTVSPRLVTISVSPSFALNVNGGQQIPFTATVTNGSTSTVTWSAVLGTINAAGLYTAPASPPNGGTDTITATSVADPTKSATSTVNFATNLFDA